MWMITDPPPPDLVPTWISSIAAVAGVLVGLGALIFAAIQIGQTSTQMRRSSLQEAQNSEEQTRPYVGVDVVPGIGGHSSFDVVFENFGRTTAHDVSVSLASEAFRAQSDGDQIGPALGRLFAVPFDLPPRARRRVLWRIPDNENSSTRGDKGAPLAGEVVVSYVWRPADARAPRHYTDTLKYDLTEYPKLIARPTRGSSTAGGEGADLKNAVHALRAISENVGELRR